MVRVSIIKDHATRVVDVGRNGSNVQGGTAVDHLRLCLEGDTVLFTYVGSDCGWEVDSGIRPHRAELVRAATQTGIAHDTDTKVAFDAASYDFGGIADTTNDWILIRRTGLYMVAASWGKVAFAGGFDDGERIITWIRKFSGASSTSADRRLVHFILSPRGPIFGSGESLISTLNVPLLLTAGDKLEMNVEQTSGGTVSTDTSVIFRPTLVVSELR